MKAKTKPTRETLLPSTTASESIPSSVRISISSSDEFSTMGCILARYKLSMSLPFSLCSRNVNGVKIKKESLYQNCQLRKKISLFSPCTMSLLPFKWKAIVFHLKYETGIVSNFNLIAHGKMLHIPLRTLAFFAK